MSGIPNLKVEVAFVNNPFDTSLTWTDISQYVLGCSTTMGRQHELQQVNPSTATISLFNSPTSHGDTTGGRFSPWNTNSPYYHSGTGLTPGHPVRVTSTVSGTTYPIFYGYVKSWVPSYGQSTSNVTLTCQDVLGLLNLNTLDVDAYGVYPLANATNYWPLSDQIGSQTAVDQTGSLPLTPLGAVTFGNAGPFITTTSTAAAADGFGNIVSTGSTASTATGTVDGWVKTTSIGATILYTGNSLAVYLSLAASTGYPQAHINGTTVTGSVALNDGAWHYLAFTYNGTNIVLYADGVSVATGTTTGSLPADRVTLGFLSSDYSIAQVAYYPSALSPAVIAQQYQIGTAGFVVQDSGSRISTVLELAGLPAGLNNVGTGVVQVAAATGSLATTTVFSYISTIVSTERGFLFQDPSGVVQFYNRHYPYENAAANTSNATYGYASGQLHYDSTSFVPGEDDLDLWNNINVGRQGGVVQNASDMGSQTAYGRRTLTGYTSMLFTNDDDSWDLASGLLYQYKNPATRVRSLSQDSTINAGANLSNMGGRGLLDRITVNWRPIDGSGVDFSQESLIEAINHTFTPEVWSTTWAVTPIGTESFGLYGTGTYGTAIYGF